MVIKEWRDVARNVLYRTTFPNVMIGMRVKTLQCKPRK